MALTLRWGTVTAVTQRLDEIIRCEVDGAPCIAYPRQTGPVEVGDTVLVNTQGRDLGARLRRLRHRLREPDARARTAAGRRAAHVMALPYTPGQSAVACVEEHDALAEELDGLPVVCCGLHSQLAPVVAGIGTGRADRVRAARQEARCRWRCPTRCAC